LQHLRIASRCGLSRRPRDDSKGQMAAAWGCQTRLGCADRSIDERRGKPVTKLLQVSGWVASPCRATKSKYQWTFVALWSVRVSSGNRFSNGMFSGPLGRTRPFRADLRGGAWQVARWAAAASPPDPKAARASGKPARFVAPHRARPASGAAPPHIPGCRAAFTPPAQSLRAPAQRAAPGLQSQMRKDPLHHRCLQDGALRSATHGSFRVLVAAISMTA